MSDLNDQAAQKSPHPLTEELLRWTSLQPFAKDVPADLMTKLRELSAEEQCLCLDELCGFCVAIIHSGRPQRGLAVFMGVRTLLRELPEHAAAVDVPFLLAHCGVARTFGNLDKVIELLPKIPGAARPELDRLLTMYLEIRDLRERLKSRIGDKRAGYLSVLLQPVDRHVVIEIFEREPWVQSSEFRELLRELLPQSSPELQPSLRYLLTLVDAESRASSEARAQAGRKSAAELLELAKQAVGAGEAEGMFLAADRLEVPEIAPAEAGGLLVALCESDRRTVSDIIPVWLFWRSAQKAKWPEALLAHLAFDVLDLMRPASGEYAVLKRRKELGEYALKHAAEEESSEWTARLYYALMHICVRLSEFEGETPELVNKQYLAGRHAMTGFLQLGDVETAAQCIDITLLARIRLPEENGGGLQKTLAHIDELLAPAKEKGNGDKEGGGPPPLIRAALLTCRHRFSKDMYLDAADYAQRRAELEEAFQIFSTDSGEHAKQNAVRLCSFLANLEFRHALHSGEKSFTEARKWSERGFEFVETQSDPEGFIILVMSHVQILREQRDFAAALLWVQKGLAIPGITSTFRASLLLDRARLRLSLRESSVESLRAGLQELDEAARVLGSAQNEELRWSLIRCRAELHRELGEQMEAVRVLQRGLRAWQHLLSPTHCADLRVELIPLLQRRKVDGLADEDEAAHELDALLVDAQTLPWEALYRVCEAAWAWLYYHCLHPHNLLYTAERAAALESLAKSARDRLSLTLLIDVWRGRATGTPSLPELFARIEAKIVEEPRNAEPLLGLGLYLALRECEDDTELLQRWAVRLEVCLLALVKEAGSTGAVDFLITLANMRLDAPPGPILINSQAARRLIEKAEELYPEAQLAPTLRARLGKARLRARLRCLGLTPGQDAHKLAIEAQLLAREAEELNPDERLKFLEELHHWLVNYAAPDATPLRAYAKKLRADYGVGDVDAERGAKLDELTQLSKKDQIKLQALREQGVPKDLAKSLLRGEHMAQLVPADPKFGDDGLAVLTPLLSHAAAALDASWRAAFTARVHRALGWLWMRHKSQDLRQTLTKAITHFECASALWPISDPDGFLDIAHEHGNALWRFEAKDKAERGKYADRAQRVIQEALAHSRAAEFPVRQAMLYRLLGLVEQHSEQFHNRIDDQRFSRMLGHHEKALALCPDSEVDTRFQISITLANACRDGYQDLGGREKDRLLLERAIRIYREALALTDQLELSPPTEPARAKKCFADALAMRAHEGDLAEAKALLLESLETRTEKHFPVPRAESLLSLTELELLRHGRGEPGALEAARRAAVECQSLLAADASPGVEKTIAALLTRIERLLEGKAVDASGSGRPGPLVIQHLLDELGAEAPAHLPLDPRVQNMGVFEGNIAKSVLFPVMRERVVASLKLREDFAELKKDELYVPLGMVLARIEDALAREGADSARKYLDGAYSCLCGNPEDFPASEIKRFFLLTEKLLTEEFLSRQPWEKAAMWRHQAVHALHGAWLNLTEANWDWLERQERAAATALEAHSSEDPYLPEFWKSLGLVLWKRPHGAFKDRHREALDLFQKALELSRKQNQTSLGVGLLNDLATLLHEMSREEPALLALSIQYYGEIIEQCGPTGKHLNFHQMALGNRGWARITLPPDQQPQGFRDAVADLEKALELCGDSPFFLRNRAHHYIHLGLAHTDLAFYEPGHQTRAIECYEAAIELCKILKDPIEESRATHNLGLLFMRMGGTADLTRAKELLETALQRRRGRVVEEWETLGTLVGVRMRMRVPFGMLQDDEALLRQVENLLAGLVKQQQPERALITHQYLFDLVRGRPRPNLSELIQHVEQALQFAEKAWAASSRTIAQHKFSQDIALWAARRAVLAVDGGAEPLEILRHGQRGKARTLRWQRAVLLDLPPALRSTHAAQLSKLQELNRSSRPEDLAASLLVEEEITKLLRGQSAEATLPEIDRAGLIDRLRQTPQTAFIDLSVTDFGSVCVRAYLGRDGELVLDSKRLSLTTHIVQSWLDDDPRSDRAGWHTTLERVGNTLMHKECSDAELLEVLESGHAICMQMLSRIFEDVMAPLTADLMSQGIVDLSLCLPGILGQLPIAAAYRLNADGTPRYLIEDFRSLALVPAATTFLEKVKSASRLRRAATVLTENSLPKEASDSVARLVSRFRNVGMTTRELREAGNGRQHATAAFAMETLGEFDLVHFVCHGQFKSHDVENAGLILADGEKLSASRLLRHPLTSPAALVVLAACRSGQTASHDLGGEWLGFSGALLRIGVSDVVAGLWDVETRATMRLIDGFYEAHLSHEQRPAISLATAMREQIRLGRLGEAGGPHPLTDHASDLIQQRLRRLCASPLWWAGLVTMQAR